MQVSGIPSGLLSLLHSQGCYPLKAASPSMLVLPQRCYPLDAATLPMLLLFQRCYLFKAAILSRLPTPTVLLS